MALRARMSGAEIVIEGDERARAKLERLQGRLRSLDWLWPNIIDLFQQKERQWFVSEGQGGWPALSPAYAAWKTQVFPGRPLMVRTGDLRDSLTSRSAILARTDTMLSLGTSVSYAGFHLGGPKMPRRMPLIPTVSLVAGIVRRIQFEIERF